MSYYEEIKKTHPYTAQYAEKYGIESLASTFEVPPKFKDAEEMYKECILKDKRWNELVQQVKEGTIL